MAALDFPNSPTPGQQFQAPTGILYQYGTPARWTTAQATPQNSQMAAGDNLLANGEFSIWQRGTSFAGLTGITATYTADRWRAQAGAGSTISASQALQPTTDPRRVAIQLQRTVTGSAEMWLSQRIEDVRTMNGQTVALSFDVYATVAGSYKYAFNQIMGTGGSPSADIFGPHQLFTVNAANTWERKTLTYLVPSLGAVTLGTNSNSSLDVFIGAPSAIGNVSMYVSNVDLRLGSVAPPQFLRRPYQQELALCQRYYQAYSNVQIFAGAAGQWLIDFPYSVAMRTQPTATLGTVTYSNASGMTVNANYSAHVRLLATVSAGPGWANAGTMTLDAEL